MTAKNSKSQGWRTSMLTVQMFKRWAFIVTLITAVLGLFVALQIVEIKKDNVLHSTIDRLQVQTAGRAELVRLWSDNLRGIGKSIVDSDLIRLYVAESSSVENNKSNTELSNSLEAQRPYMQYMLNEFAKQHNLVSVFLTDARGNVLIQNTDALPLDEAEQAAMAQVAQDRAGVILPARPVGDDLLLDVIRPIFPLAEQADDTSTIAGMLFTTHNVTEDVARLMEPQPLDNKGESFALLQMMQNEISRLSDTGLESVTKLPKTDGHAADSISGDERVYPVAHNIEQTPFIAWGEFAKSELQKSYADSKRAIIGTAVIITLLVMVAGLILTWNVLNQYSRQRNQLQDQTMQTLVRAIEIRDPYLAGHHQRLAKTALTIAKDMDLDAQQRSTLFYAAQLSGIGMIFVPQEILTKPGRLTPPERKQLQEHVKHAATVLEGVEFDLPVEPVITQMHERLDGSGYPKKLKGDRIDLLAQILGVADVYCALTSPRVYRKGLKHQEALDILKADDKAYNQAAVKALTKLAK